MYERKLMGKAEDSLAKALELLMLNQQLTNQEVSKSNNKENKKKVAAKSLLNPRVSSIKTRHSRLSPRSPQTNSSSYLPKLSSLARRTDEFAKGLCGQGRSTIRKIN